LTLFLAGFLYILTKIWRARGFFVDLKKRGMVNKPLHDVMVPADEVAYGPSLFVDQTPQSGVHCPIISKDIIKTYIFEVVVSRFGKN
jgi:hypothetical protein